MQIHAKNYMNRQQIYNHHCKLLSIYGSHHAFQADATNSLGKTLKDRAKRYMSFLRGRISDTANL